MLKVKNLCYLLFTYGKRYEYYWDASNPLFAVDGGHIQLFHWNSSKFLDTSGRFSHDLEISNIVMDNYSKFPIIPILCS